MGVANPTSSLVIHTQCGITDTQYNYTVLPNDIVCDAYTFTVTPVNIVGNGTSASTTRGILPSGKQLNYIVNLKSAILCHEIELNSFNVQVVSFSY